MVYRAHGRLNHISYLPAWSARGLEESRDDGQQLHALALSPKERPPDSHETGDDAPRQRNEREREVRSG
jgi:hypothetical protein